MDHINTKPTHDSLLKTFRGHGNAALVVEQILEVYGTVKIFTDFTRENVERLADFMVVYPVKPGKLIIREGNIDDFMMFVIEERINIVKTDSYGEPRPITTVSPSATLGEMSMVKVRLLCSP